MNDSTLRYITLVASDYLLMSDELLFDFTGSTPGRSRRSRLSLR